MYVQISNVHYVYYNQNETLFQLFAYLEIAQRARKFQLFLGFSSALQPFASIKTCLAEIPIEQPIEPPLSRGKLPTARHPAPYSPRQASGLTLTHVNFVYN